MTAPAQVTFRTFQGEADYPLIMSILVESARGDQIQESASVDDIRSWYAPSSRFDPYQDLVFAYDIDQAGKSTPIGFNRLFWYDGLGGARLYYQDSYLLPDWRDRGVWPVMVRRNEQRLREIAAGHPGIPKRFFQAWATACQVKWIATLEGEGYQAVRHFHNMLHRLEDIPQRTMPAGLEVRPVKPEHFRKIWEAQREVQMELFEVVLDHWTEDRYESWAAHPSHTPHLWQVAWDGDQVVGMILNRIDDEENKTLGRKRGYTEHIFVRKPWRKIGLASALLSRSLQLLKEQGIQEVELGVDSENESGAFDFYQRMGYQTISIDIWFRKPYE